MPRSLRAKRSNPGIPKESGIQKAAEFPRAARVFELSQRFRLDLADALASHRELLTDLFEGVVGVHTEPDTHPEHPLLAGRQPGQDTGRGLPQIGLDRGIERKDRILVLDEITE